MTGILNMDRGASTRTGSGKACGYARPPQANTLRRSRRMKPALALRAVCAVTVPDYAQRLGTERARG